MTRLHAAFALSPFAIALLLGAWGMSQAPERSPVHWGPSGQPDQWGSPFQALILPTLPMLLGAGVLLFLARRSAANRNNGSLFWIAALGLGLLALVMTAGSVFHLTPARTTLVGIGLLFALIGHSLSRAVPNAFVGLRTPWVYLSRRAWHTSQRRSGLWLAVYGLILLGSGLVLPLGLLVPWVAPYGITVGIIVIVLGLTLMSYVDYKRDPDPIPVEIV